MKRTKLISLAILLSLSAVASCEDSLKVPVGCQATVSSNKQKKSWKYDLSSLNHDPELSDELFYRDPFGNIFYINPCGSATTACTPPQTVCARAATYTLQGYGILATQRIMKINLTDSTPGRGVTVTYGDGYECLGSSSRRSAVVHVVCREGVEEYVQEVVTSSDGCSVTMIIKGPAGCGKEVPFVPGSDDDDGGGGGIGAGGIILILLIVAAAVYVVGGGVYNYKVREARSFTTIVPNWSFWSSLPLLVKDGVLFIGHGFKKGDYTSL